MMKRTGAVLGLAFLLTAGAAGRSGIGAAATLKLAAFPAASAPSGSVNVLTYHSDYSRTGQNLSETSLTPANVGGLGLGFNTGLVGTFNGSLGIRNQPLVMTGLTVGGQSHDVVFVATTASYVYAIDAYGGQILWRQQVLPSAFGGSVEANGIYNNFTSGITSTPVIDPGTNTLYTCTHVQESASGNTYDTWWLVAMDVSSGNYKLGSPVLMASSIGDTYISGPTPTVNGVGEGPSGQPAGQVAFDSYQAGQRAALTLNGGSIWIPISAPGSTNGPFHGWILGYNQSTLQPTAVFCTTPNDPNSTNNGGGGIWGSGGGLVVDGSGNMYFATGNGLFDTTLDTNGFPNLGDYGDCIVKVAIDPGSNPNNQNVNGWGLRVVDYFTPYNTTFVSQNDFDLSSGSPMLLPSGKLVHAGKNSVLYVLDTNNLGGYHPGGDQVFQEMTSVVNCGNSTPTYFNGNVYYIPTRNDNNPASAFDHLKMFAVQGDGTLSSPTSQGPDIIGYNGCSCAISANGNSNGIVWVVDSGIGTSGVSSLKAYDATNVGNQLVNIQLPSSVSPWATPTVANGWVYVPMQNGLAGYMVGGTPPPPPPPGIIQDPSYENQTQADGTPFIPPWSAIGPAGSGVDDTNGRNGTHCGYIYDGGSGGTTNVVQTISVTPNTTYTLACYLQTDGTFPAQGAMGVQTTGGTVIAQQTYGQLTNYTQISVSFNSQGNTSVVIFAGFTDQGAGAWIHVDDWSISGGGGSPPPPGSGVIHDPSYENQTQADGSPLIPPWSAEGPAGSGVDDTNGRNGTHCGYIYDGGTGGTTNIIQTITVTPNVSYTLSCYLQTDGTFPAQGAMGVRTTSGTVLAQQTYGQLTNYTQISVSFNSEGNTSVVIFAGFTDQAAGAWIHVDDWGLQDGTGAPPPGSGVIHDPSYENQTQADGSPLIPPWSAEGPAGSGVDDTNGRNGTHCGYIYDGGTGGTTHIIQTLTVTTGTTYTLSCYLQTDGTFPAQGAMGVRTTSGTVLAQQTYGQLTNYTQVGVSFNSQGNNTVVIFAGFTDQAAGAWIHVDDWSLTAGGSTPPPVGSGVIQDPNYDNQSNVGGSPLVPPWSSETAGGVGSGVDDVNGMNGSKCAWIYDPGTGAWSDVVQTVTVAQNTNYTLTCDVQTDGTFPAQGAMGVRTTSGTVLAQQTYGQLTNYTQLSVSFNSGSNTSLVIFAGFTSLSGQGPAWIHVDTWNMTH